MRRQTVYPGQIPLETDILSTNKNVMIAIGHLLQDMIGTSTLFSGLGCVPTSPAGMTVNVNPGRAYSYQATDSGAYSSLAADAHQIVKQGILLDAVNFACAAPTTAGYSINYLVEAAFQEVDAGSVVLPYYNASNPAQAYSGPNGTGTSNTTYRDNTVQLQLKAGIAATTGSQVTPTPDAGFNGLWVVSVPYGATSITAGMITQYSGAPFLSSSLLAQIQAPIPGRLLRTSVYINNAGTLQVSIDGAAFVNASSTFTPLTATTAVELEGCGGGGGGGGALTTGASQSSAGSGGGSGSYFKKKVTSGFAGVTVQVGVAGSVSTGNAGTSGGTTSFGGIVSAPGGLGGPVGSAVANTTSNFVGGTGTVVATGGDINGQSDSGKPGFISTTPIGGAGGQSPFGGGAVISSGTSSGNTSNSYGAGGGGACLAANNATNASGGLPLKSGVLIVRELA